MSPRQITWKRLVPGLITLGVVIAAAVVVLVFARVGSLRGDTFQLYVLADEARGVIKGTEVWLAGQKIGMVRRVTFRPVSSDTLGRLVVELELLQQYQRGIRRDSRVEFRSGSTPIGATIVAIGMGSAHSPAVRAGDTLARAPQIDPDSVRAQITAAVQDLPPLLHEIDQMNVALRRNFSEDASPAAAERAQAARRLAENATQLDAHLGTENGTLPHLLHDRALADRARIAAQRADSLIRLLGANTGTLGRIQHDSAFIRALATTRNDMVEIRSRLLEEHGTAGRLARDSALAEQLHRISVNLDAILHDVVRNPGEYITF